MSAIARKIIRQRIRDRVLTVPDYTESPFHPQSLGRNPKNRGDKRFSVWFGNTTDNGGRQRESEGVSVSYPCVVSFLTVVTPHNAITAYETAMDGEEAIIAAIINPTTPLYNNIQIRYDSSNTAELSDTGEWMLTTINFTINSYLQL